MGKRERTPAQLAALSKGRAALQRKWEAQRREARQRPEPTATAAPVVELEVMRERYRDRPELMYYAVAGWILRRDGS